MSGVCCAFISRAKSICRARTPATSTGRLRPHSLADTCRCETTPRHSPRRTPPKAPSTMLTATSISAARSAAPRSPRARAHVRLCVPRVPAHREASPVRRLGARHATALPRGAGPDAKLRPSIGARRRRRVLELRPGRLHRLGPGRASRRRRAGHHRLELREHGRRGERSWVWTSLVLTDEQRLRAAGLFASCAALVLRGVCGVQLGEEAGSPLAWAELLGSVAARTGSRTWAAGIFHWRG